MWKYEKKLQYPVNIKNPNPKAAKFIISQLGGPDGELAASLRYLNQRFSMPYSQLKGLLTDIGTEELAHQTYIRKTPPQGVKISPRRHFLFVVFILQNINRLVQDLLHPFGKNTHKTGILAYTYKLRNTESYHNSIPYVLRTCQNIYSLSNNYYQQSADLLYQAFPTGRRGQRPISTLV